MDSVPQEELDNLDDQLGAVFGEYFKRRTDKRNRALNKLPEDEKSLMHFRAR